MAIGGGGTDARQPRGLGQGEPHRALVLDQGNGRLDQGLPVALGAQGRVQSVEGPVVADVDLVADAVIRPIAVDDSGFTVETDGYGGFIVRGTRPERWIAQTNFDNDEAVGYLGDRLARLGVEDALWKKGAKPGCAVTIGDMTFDWEPQTPAGVDMPLTGRGTDIRLEQTDRIGAAERKAARRERRQPGSEDA